jgi:pimeloyl-ACP methyl ester carboxylesterase
MLQLEPYRVDVDREVVEDLWHRLDKTRWPAPDPGGAWSGGTDLVTLRGLCEYWRTGFDWFAAQDRLNAWPQVRTIVDGQPLHAIHARSPHPHALPLVLTHGWPGSVAEFLRVIDPLVDPPAYGGDAADAFHVVAPSLPGFGFSGPTRTPGWHPRRTAEAVAQLMATLGYDRYGAQGGDYGAMVTTQLGLVDTDHLAGIHLNMVIAMRPKGPDPFAGVTDAERTVYEAAVAKAADVSGYQQIQRSRPQTLGFGLHDSPAGLAAWILEKFREWSDCGGDVTSRFSADELLTNIMIYWVTGTITSSCRLYAETARAGRGYSAPDRFVPVPMGYARFPADGFLAPRAWVERSYDVRRWTEMPSGGHFAAMEAPALLVDDVRAFFRDLR